MDAINEIMNHLSQEGIDTRPFFFPLHTLPPFLEAASRPPQPMDLTNRLGANRIVLPTYNQPKLSDVDRITMAIRNLAAGRSSLLKPDNHQINTLHDC